MDTKQLQYFLALSRQEHMSLTAEFLNISQPALSKSIRNLEKELGVELFDRHGNHIKLNPNGQEFAEYAARSLAELDHGKRLIQQSRFDYRGSVRITCHAFADSILDCITDYMALNPQIHIHLFQTTKGDEKITDRSNFLLRGYGAEDTDREWISMPLFREQYYILISPRYREYPPEITALSPDDLKNELFIADFLETELFDYIDIMQQMSRSAGFRPKVVCSTDDFLTKIHMVAEGQGITVLPQSCLRTVHKLAPDVQAFQIMNFSSTRTVCLMRKKDTMMNEVGRDFWEFAEAYYQDSPK